MAKPVAKINGNEVYSDKKVRAIVDSIVHFTDSSWCDVATGQVVNNGPGYINIGSPGKGNGEKKVKKQFSGASALEVMDLCADVEIKVGGSRIEVEAEGCASDIESLRVGQQGSTVIVTSTNGGRGGGITVRSGGSVTRVTSFSGSGSVVIGGDLVCGSVISTRGRGGTVIIGGGGAAIKISINVPKKTAISISNVDGCVKIGDNEGILSISVRGGSKVRAGKVADASLNVSGSGDVDIREVNGNLNASVAGSGDVDVKGGQAPNLTVGVSGSGNVRFGGKATNAMLSVSGSGDIWVRHVENRPMKSVAGSGRIRVDNWC